MIDRANGELSITRQCRLLEISRSSFYYEPCGESMENLVIMRRIDELYLEYPFFGSRRMAYMLRREGYSISRHRARRLMQLMGITAIYRKPRTSEPNPAHKKYPYLLKGLDITRPNQVWCTDITYIPMRKGFLHLIAIMDWYSRKVLSWRLSSTMDTVFCIEALKDALKRYGRPEIFNSDQGSQFTSLEFTGVLEEHGIRISMDGKGRWRDNVFIERVWKSLKYECVYLKAFENGLEAKAEIGRWLRFYNEVRPHLSFAGLTPDQVYYERTFVLPASGSALRLEEQNTRQAA